MNGRVFLIACILPVIAWAQSFGGLGSKAADEFATPQRNFVFDFPTDHGAHPDYRIEWWYLTANLEDPAGVQYGLQWTLFRTAVAPGEEEGPLLLQVQQRFEIMSTATRIALPLDLLNLQ